MGFALKPPVAALKTVTKKGASSARKTAGLAIRLIVWLRVMGSGELCVVSRESEVVSGEKGVVGGEQGAGPVRHLL